MRRDAVALRQLEAHREETVLGRVPIKDRALCACRKNGWGWSPLDFRWRHHRLIDLIDRMGHRHRKHSFQGRRGRVFSRARKSRMIAAISAPWLSRAK